MKYCPECGEELEDNPKHCPECGEQLKGEEKDNRPLIVAGIGSALISTLFLPPVFGIASLYCGYRTYNQGDENWGAAVIGIGIIMMTFGMVVGAIVATT